MSDLNVERMLGQTSQSRYWLTVRSATRTGELFGLTSESQWELTPSFGRRESFAIWPTYLIARHCSDERFPSLRPCPFEFDEWCEQWFATLTRYDIPIEVFPTLSSAGERVSPSRLMADIESVASCPDDMDHSNTDPGERWLLAGRPPSCRHESEDGT